jgi:alanine racemase
VSDVPATGRLTVDLDALARNYRRLAAAAAPEACAAVIKADAYGLGLTPVAQALRREGCARFFVATAAEGAALRSLAPEAAIYVLEGLVGEDGEALGQERLTPALNSLQQVERWAGTAWARGATRPAVLHLDTGMTRLGLSESEVEQLAGRRDLLDALDIELVMTHLACADEPDHPLNDEQIRRFDALRAKLPAAPTSIGNSAGTLSGRARRGDVARLGIALYGGNPFSDRDNPMERVVTLEAKIIQTRVIDAPCTVGYGATYVVRAPARLAVLGVGYADGYPRCLGNRAAVAVAGRRAPVIGRVSMDLICIDVSGIDPDRARLGDWVELVGPTISLEEVAAAADTINYEILTGLGRRLERRYVERVP